MPKPLLILLIFVSASIKGLHSGENHSHHAKGTYHSIHANLTNG